LINFNENQLIVEKTYQKNDFLQRLLDAVPSIFLVVDEDVRIHFFNKEAEKIIGQDAEYILKKRGGEALQCLHSTETELGCGHSASCKNCQIRNAAKAAMDGRSVYRENVKMELNSDSHMRYVFYALTASPFDHDGKKLVLIILENISEVLQLRNLLPICSRCNKLRDDQNYWVSVESYLKINLDQLTSQSLCPDCILKVYPDYFMKTH
jgi:PAS domain-containing protein